MLEAVGVLELTSVGIGYAAQDALLKAADVKLLLARTICSGKYFLAVTGDVANVTAAVEAGLARIPDGLIDHGVIARIHPQVFKALNQAVEFRVPFAADTERQVPKAVGIIETYSGTSVLEAADVAAKAAPVALLRIHLAMALGGKGYLLMAGNVADVQIAVEAGAAAVRKKGLLVSAVSIPGPARELFEEYI